MSPLVIPAPPPDVPSLEPRPSGAEMVAPLRAASTAAENVSDWAETGGVPPGWNGDAAASASHAMTRLAGEAGAAVAVLTRVSTALDTFFDTVTSLQQRRRDLVEEHSSLSARQQALTADGAFYTPEEEAALQQRAAALTSAIEAFAARVTAWVEEVARAEDTVIAALQGSDTATEAVSYAASRSGQVDAMVTELVTAGTLPPHAVDMTAAQLREWLIDNPAAAAALMQRRPLLTDGLGLELARLTGAVVTAPGGANAVHDQRRLDARALFEGLSSEDAALLATLYPGLVGKLDGAPFENRAAANTVAVIDALAAEHGNLDDLRHRDEINNHDGDWFGRNNNDLDGPIKDAADRVALYESILKNDRQILYFDPTGDGAIAELHGEISDRTRNVAVLVPGTGTDMTNYQGIADRSESFVQARADGDLAAVSWMGGDLPDSVPKDAPFASYSQTLGPQLANFSHDVRQEVMHSAAPHDTATTYVGHSYGGAVVGTSEAYALDADRVLHVESAGVGHNIFSTADLPDSQNDVDRYSMTAPGDPIAASQGQQHTTDRLLRPWQVAGEVTDAPAPGAVSHGADPDTFGETVRLHTGNYENGEPVRGLAAHGGVFTPRSDSWEAALGVMTGETVETYREPVYTTQYGPYGSSSHPQTGWGPGQTVDVP